MVKKGKKSNIYAESKIKKMNAKHPLSQPQKRNFRLGNHIKPSIIKARFVKWPRYVRLQRQKRILFRRLKVPAAIAQFCSPLDKSNTSTLLKALAKYTPETRKQKHDRIKAKAQAKVTKGKEAGSDKPLTIKFGLNHVTHLIEQKKAKLVIIASDVDPIENVVFLPTLCKAMDIPYCIVNNKSRLGELVHKKTATVLAVTDFKLAANDFSNIVRVCKESFNNAHPRVKNPEKGIKSTIREIKLRKLLNAEEAKKNNN